MPLHPNARLYLDGALGDDPFLREIILTSDASFDPAITRRLFDDRVNALGVPADGVVVVSEERLSGHAATGGFDTFRIANRLAAVLPDAVVFFVVREQVEMIESEYLQLVQEGSPASLKWLLEFKPRAASLPGFDLGHYEYDRLADHYVQLFGKQNVRLFEFDALRKDPQAFLDAVALYIGVEPWPRLSQEILTRRTNPALPRGLIGLRRFLNKFERRPLNPHPVFTIPAFWRRPLWWLGSRVARNNKPLIDARTRTELRERYREPNARLALNHAIKFGSAPTDLG